MLPTNALLSTTHQDCSEWLDAMMAHPYPVRAAWLAPSATRKISLWLGLIKSKPSPISDHRGCSASNAFPRVNVFHLLGHMHSNFLSQEDGFYFHFLGLPELVAQFLTRTLWIIKLRKKFEQTLQATELVKSWCLVFLHFPSSTDEDQKQTCSSQHREQKFAKVIENWAVHG